MKILIASPTYDGSVRKEYMQSVMVTVDFFNKNNIAWDICIEPATLLSVARSVMATKAVDEEFSHLLFIDTDMAFPIGVIEKMIKTNTDLIGCACPYRTIPFYENITNIEGSFRDIISETVPYAIKPLQSKSITVTDGICEVLSIGTGLLLISTNALKSMIDRGCVAKYRNHFPYSQWHHSPTYYGFFDHVVLDDAHVGEDYSFCLRWVNECNGKVYAIVDYEILHIGNIPIMGRYVDKLRKGKS